MAFLVPDEGFSDLVGLHDAPYTGPLRAELRLDLPFIPHFAVANATSAERCKNIVDDLNAQRREIHARVEKLDIIAYDGKKTWAIEQSVLGGSRV